jgi:hypothetical protein
MANFPQANRNKIIDSDPQIKRVDLDTVETAGRQSAQPKEIKNDMTLKHVTSKDR